MQHSEYAQAVLSAHGSVLPGEDRRGVGDIIRPPRLALPATISLPSSEECNSDPSDIVGAYAVITSEEFPVRAAAHHLGGDLGLGARHVDL